MTWRLINVQGWVGLAASLALLGLLLVQKGETRHWRKQSGQYEQLYRHEQSAFAGTVANYRAAAEAARAADRAAAERVATEQRAINERTAHDYEARLAAARAAAADLASGRLRSEARTAAADSGSRGAAPVPGLSAAPRRTAKTPGQDRLPVGTEGIDWRLTATEQAIQLDELIKWVRRQAAVDQNGAKR